ncbi:hypothetical protein ACTMTI_28305 [Nonomuraea sp. H19]|uniref:hypothetical protein n=1 Tax=Nonomuraea sp. H19 TaxID=3452206 RepID=UPI003F887B1A
MTSGPEPVLDRHSPSLQSADRGLQAAVEQLHEHWQALGNALQQLEPMVGNDLISQLIGSSFQAIREAADDTLASVMEGLQSRGSGVLQMDANITAAEQASMMNIDPGPTS